MEIQWEEPPAHANVLGESASGRYLAFALALREYPGRWAVLPATRPRTEKSALAAANNIRRGKTKGFKPNQYDAAVHEGTIWVRFKESAAVPPDEAEASTAPSEPEEERDSTDWTPDPARVRTWAIEQGMEVPQRGRLPKRCFEAYEQAVARGEIDPEEDPDGPLDQQPDQDTTDKS
jgi:hypothetical protein